MCEALADAVSGGDLGELRFLLGAGVSVNTPFPDGMYPLNVALMSGHEHIARELIHAGANIDSEDSFRIDESCRHPVHYAASGNCLGCLEVILQHGVDVDACDYVDATPLHHAAANGHLAVTAFLVDSGCDVNHCSKSGRSALWKAAQAGHIEVVKYLLEAGTDVNIQNKVSATVLFDLVKDYKYLLIAEYLLQNGLKVHKMDLVGNTALHVASSVGQTECVKLLLSHGADVDAVNEHGNTALHNAATHDKVHTTTVLLNHGACYSLLNIARQSPLYMAMLHKHHRTVALLWAAGARLSHKEHVMYQRFEVSRFQAKEDFYSWACTLFHSPLSLSGLCRTVIRDCLLPSPGEVLGLPIPNVTKQFLLLQDLLDLDLSDSDSSSDSSSRWMKVVGKQCHLAVFTRNTTLVHGFLRQTFIINKDFWYNFAWLVAFGQPVRGHVWKFLLNNMDILDGLNFKSSIWNLFEDWVPTDFIYGCPTLIRATET